MCHRLTIQLYLCLSCKIYQRFPVSQQSWKPAAFCTALAVLCIPPGNVPRVAAGSGAGAGGDLLHRRAQEAYESLNKSKYTVHSPLQLPDQAESCGDSGFLPLPHLLALDSTDTSLSIFHTHFSISFYPANCGRNPAPLVT